MKTIFLGCILVASALSANAGEFVHPNEQAPANAPVCPPGQVARFVGVVDGHAVWECVPIGS